MHSSSSVALYRQESELFHPSPASGGPWSRTHQHGGPPCGLLAFLAQRKFEQHVGTETRRPKDPAADHATHRETVPSWRPARLHVDLFRPVPLQPLRGDATIVRAGRRLGLVQAWLSDQQQRRTCQAQVLFLRQANLEDDRESTHDARQVPPVPPPGEVSQSMIATEHRAILPPGFHFEVEVCWRTWPAAQTVPGAWIRMPMPLLHGSLDTPFLRAATLSDFANAVTGHRRAVSGVDAFSYINCDSTLRLSRCPVGRWFFLTCEHFEAVGGIGHTSVAMYDERGRCGTIQQTSLRQSRGAETSRVSAGESPRSLSGA